MEKPKIRITPKGKGVGPSSMKSHTHGGSEGRKIVIKHKQAATPPAGLPAWWQGLWTLVMRHRTWALGALLLLLLGAGAAVLGLKSDSSVPAPAPPLAPPPAPPPVAAAPTWFGLSLANYAIIGQGVLDSMHTPYEILLEHGVGLPEGLLAGGEAETPPLNSYFEQSRYVLLGRRPAGQQPHTFVFEAGPYAYWQLGLADSLYARRYQRRVQQLRQQKAFLIRSSLRQSLAQLPHGMDLALKIDSALAWTVDVYHLKAGATLKLLYDETRVDGQVRSIDRLQALCLQQDSSTHYAFYFDQPGYEGYYDQDAYPMKTTFLRAPVRYTRISSPMGSRVHPISGKKAYHFGTDYAAPFGTPIYAVADGRVLKAAFHSANGYYVQIQHGEYEAFYLHMQKNSFPPGLKKGVQVKQGQLIGRVGATGLAEGPHVCFHLRKHGKPIDPTRMRLPRSNPLPAQLLPAFLARVDSLKTQLDLLTYAE